MLRKGCSGSLRQDANGGKKSGNTGAGTAIAIGVASVLLLYRYHVIMSASVFWALGKPVRSMDYVHAVDFLGSVYSYLYWCMVVLFPVFLLHVMIGVVLIRISILWHERRLPGDANLSLLVPSGLVVFASVFVTLFADYFLTTANLITAIVLLWLTLGFVVLLLWQSE